MYAIGSSHTCISGNFFFQTINTPLDVIQLDLSSLKSVRKFADEFKSRDWFVSVVFLSDLGSGVEVNRYQGGFH